MASEGIFEQLKPHLFPDDETNTYAIIDGAACEDLLDKLDEHQPEHCCLYAGELEPDVAECAPYLVKLDPESEFTHWLIDEGCGKHWGIFGHSSADLKATRKHFRGFLLVKAPDGKTIYFRYYDPRVLIAYLPTTNADEREVIFGEISSFLSEDSDQRLLLFRRSGANLETLVVSDIPAHKLS